MINLPVHSVSVFGPGLMGGSLLMALRQRVPGLRLGAWARREESLRTLKDHGLVDFSGTDAAAVARETGLAVLCVPVEQMESVARSLAPGLPATSWVTDVGSVKQQVVASLEKIFSEHGNFVGSHPMCGSEQAGFAAARSDLYDSALCVLTPTASTNPAAVDAVAPLWHSVGANVVPMTAPEHDQAAATASHVPHVVAAALVRLVEQGSPQARKMCAGGFRDTTRIASGSPGLWTGILAANRQEVAAELARMGELIEDVRGMLLRNEKEKLHGFLERAASARAEIAGS